MKVLIVDDNYEKAQLITTFLYSLPNINLEVRHESTSASARLALHAHAFDFLILDLHLPSVLGDSASSTGGLDLFDMLLVDKKVNVPAEIVLATARDELLEEAYKQAAQRGLHLCNFINDPQNWEVYLAARIKLIQRRQLSQLKEASQSVDIAIVTALRDPELSAVLNLPYQWVKMLLPRDPVHYFKGILFEEGRQFSVVVASAQRKGMPSSAALASRMASTFTPKFLVMLGICAGVPDKVAIGDVVVANPTWDWGSGKLSEDNDGNGVFLAAPYQKGLDETISQKANEMSHDSALMTDIRGRWNGQLPQGSLRAHVGPMASGASVIADSKTLSAIAKQHREILAVEMEAFAVMSAVEYSLTPKPIGIAIKSVCDFADPLKGGEWQNYAAYTSAQFADKLFRRLLSTQQM